MAPSDSAATLVFPRVIAGIDFGPASLAAARWAFSHVARGAHAILSHIATPVEGVDDASDSEASNSSALRSVQRLAPALSGGLGGFAATLRVASARTVVRLGRPSHWLGALASDAEASLVVLGRRSDANRRRIGDPNVIERVTRRTNASVLVVPEGTDIEPRYVVAAVDHSASAERVIAAASAVANARGYAVIILHVLPRPTEAYARVAGSRRRGRRLVATRGDGTDTASISVETVPLHQAPGWMMDLVRRNPSVIDGRIVIAAGDPAHEIISAACAHGGSMIVVGKRGEDESPIGSIGSVARELLTTAPVPVMAVDALTDPTREVA
jgi:nucleotide-binding universal stress UspA family protein